MITSKHYLADYIVNRDCGQVGLFIGEEWRTVKLDFCEGELIKGYAVNKLGDIKLRIIYEAIKLLEK